MRPDHKAAIDNGRTNGVGPTGDTIPEATLGAVTHGGETLRWADRTDGGASARGEDNVATTAFLIGRNSRVVETRVAHPHRTRGEEG